MSKQFLVKRADGSEQTYNTKKRIKLFKGDTLFQRTIASDFASFMGYGGSKWEKIEEGVELSKEQREREITKEHEQWSEEERKKFWEETDKIISLAKNKKI